VASGEGRPHLGECWFRSESRDSRRHRSLALACTRDGSLVYSGFSLRVQYALDSAVNLVDVVSASLIIG